MRQASVMLEHRFILPARMNVEQLRVANRAKGVNAQAAWLLARRSQDVEQRFGHGALVTGARVKSREDEHLHVMSPLSCARIERRRTPGRAHRRRWGGMPRERPHPGIYEPGR